MYDPLRVLAVLLVLPAAAACGDELTREKTDKFGREAEAVDYRMRPRRIPFSTAMIKICNIH